MHFPRVMGTMAERLRKARRDAGYKTAAEFAAKHGIPQPTYALHESGKRGLKDDVLKEYAGKLGVREAWLRYGEGSQHLDEDDSPATKGGGGKSIPSKSEQNEKLVSPANSNGPHSPDVPEELRAHSRAPGGLKAGAKDLPIHGYGKGGHGGYFIDQGALVGMTYRPNILADVQDAYAVEIWDHSMYPALKHGHVALVHPRKTPLPGDEVVVVLTDGQALIKELVRRTDKALVLKQHNPPEEIRIDRARVKLLHLIVDSPRVRL